MAYQGQHIRRSKRGAILALTAALALAGALLPSLVIPHRTILATAPADIVLPPGLTGADLNAWCRDRVAAGTAGLSANAKNWLRGCIEASNPLPTPSPSPTGTPSPSPTTPSPTPTTPSPTPTTPSPTPTTPSPTPTTPVPTSSSPTPTPTGVLTGCVADPGRCGYPDANSAGAHGQLAAYTGPSTITVAGSIIENVFINSCLVVTAPNVTFRNVSIFCANPSPYVVDNGTVRGGQDAYDVGLMSFDHVTLRCNGAGGTAIGEARVLAVAVDIAGACENGFDIDDTVTVQDSYIHDLYHNPVAHTDGIQVWPNAQSIVFRHNTVLVVSDNAAFTTGGGTSSYTIEGNLLNGGSFTVYCAGHPGSLSNNRWGPIFPGTGYPAGYTTGCENMTRTGNASDVTGLPVTP